MNKIYRYFLSAPRCLGYQKVRAIVNILGRNLSYKSDLYLGKIYPNSRLQIYTPAPPTNEGDIFSGYIPLNKLNITYSRSSGPGGQHVNTVNTKVDVRFKLSDADWIPEKTKQKLINGMQNKITKEGYYVIKSDLTRSQQLNLADALEKLRQVIREYERERPVASDDTLEKVRRRQQKAVRERLIIKRNRSLLKADRQGPSNVVI